MTGERKRESLFHGKIDEGPRCEGYGSLFVSRRLFSFLTAVRGKDIVLHLWRIYTGRLEGEIWR